MDLTKLMLSVILILCQTLHLYSANAHRSSGQMIIDTVKTAYENAAKRHRRDTSIHGDKSVKLESLLLPDPTNAHLVEFDLIMDDDQFGTVTSLGEDTRESRAASFRQKRKAVRHSIYHWPGAEVPYEIHSNIDSISSQARYRIQKAMTHWERNTCVKFVKYDPAKHHNYVTIQKGQWCASKLGMAGGVQPLYVALGCLDTGTIIHELGHTLGWVHEQARPDRDQYVSIKWNLVSPSYKSQYVKHGTDFVNSYGVPYDYGSIMHYPSYGELITRDVSQQNKIGQRNRLSFNDVKLANIMYKCADRSDCNTRNIECINDGFIDHTCKCVCPEGDAKSCTVSKKILKPYSVTQPEMTTPKYEACDPWTVYENSYIPGYNEDVGFSLSIEECQTRCMHEKSFKCRSFDYWKVRRQCYLSSSSASSLGIRLRRDSRMVHYTLTECPPTKSAITTTNPPVTDHRVSKTTSYLKRITTSAPSKPRSHGCPFEYTNTGNSCVRAVGFPVRPVYIAAMDCERRLGAKIWTMTEDELQSSGLDAVVNEGEEFWVKILNYKSKSVMSDYFDFCPYITKVKGKLLLKDTLCYKSKGFFCQLEE